MRDGVCLMNAGSSKVGCPEVAFWGKVEVAEEAVDRLFDNEGIEPCDDANDARRRFCVWSKGMMSIRESQRIG
jgi:hypothetical protein